MDRAKKWGPAKGAPGEMRPIEREIERPNEL